MIRGIIKRLFLPGYRNRQLLQECSLTSDKINRELDKLEKSLDKLEAVIRIVNDGFRKVK